MVLDPQILVLVRCHGFGEIVWDHGDVGWKKGEYAQSLLLYAVCFSSISHDTVIMLPAFHHGPGCQIVSKLLVIPSPIATSATY